MERSVGSDSTIAGDLASGGLSTAPQAAATSSQSQSQSQSQSVTDANMAAAKTAAQTISLLNPWGDHHLPNL
jgi:hypothetical protein